MVTKTNIDFSTKKPSKSLLIEIKKSLRNIKGYGSIEIYIQDYKVIQITERNIKKTNNVHIQLQNQVRTWQAWNARGNLLKDLAEVLY